VATIAILTLLCAVSAVVFASAMANFQVGVSDLEKSRTYYAAEGTCLRAGDYNSVGWQPSAIMGDALNFLSNAWDDATHQVVTVSNPGGLPRVGTKGATTTVYACVLAGHTATPCDHEAPGCGTRSTYGGGLENFFRYQEVWESNLIYRGSIVSLGFAEKALGTWTNWYYSAPGRDFAFDTRLNDIANMPPGTPHLGNVVHTAFRPVLN